VVLASHLDQRESLEEVQEQMTRSVTAECKVEERDVSQLQQKAKVAEMAGKNSAVWTSLSEKNLMFLIEEVKAVVQKRFCEREEVAVDHLS
jgi:hypothetical protein